MSMRLDKYLSMLQLFTRKESRKFAMHGYFSVNWEEISKCDYKIDIGDMISIGEDLEVEVKTDITVLFHKPAGVVSSDVDEWGYPSWRRHFDDYVYAPLLHVAGRLDVDTEWLLVLTSDGQLAHRVISPKWKKEKVYHVETMFDLREWDCDQLAAGVMLDDGYETLPATCVLMWEKSLLLTLREGKYHQVKRMLEAVENKVTYLKRLKVGDWELGELEKGEWIEVN